MGMYFSTYMVLIIYTHRKKKDKEKDKKELK